MPDDVMEPLPALAKRRRTLDPFIVLDHGRDPLWAEWALRTLHKKGFGNIFGIARDFGWLVPRHSALARELGHVEGTTE